MFKKALSTATLAAVAAASMFAATAQAENNPLHPSYFQGKAAQSVQTQATGDAARYVDVTIRSARPTAVAATRTGW